MTSSSSPTPHKGYLPPLQQPIIHSCSFTHSKDIACISTGVNHNDLPRPSFNPFPHNEQRNNLAQYHSYTFYGKLSLTCDNTLRGNNLSWRNVKYQLRTPAPSVTVRTTTCNGHYQKLIHYLAPHSQLQQVETVQLF